MLLLLPLRISSLLSVGLLVSVLWFALLRVPACLTSDLRFLAIKLLPTGSGGDGWGEVFGGWW